MEPSLASAALVAEAVPAIDPVIVAAAASVPVTPRRSLVPILGMLLATSIAAASGYFLRGEVERGETLPVLSASLVASAAQEPVVAAVPAVDPPREPANVAPVEAPASTETAPATETAEPVVVAAIPAAAAPAPPIVAPPVVAPEIAAPALPVTAPPVVAAPVAAPEVAAPAAVVSQPEPVAAPESAAPGAAAAPAEPTVPTGTVGAPPALKPEAPVERMEQAEVASAPRLLPPPVAMQPNPVVRPKYSGPPTRPIDPGIYRPKAPGEAIAPAASRPAEVAAVPQARVYSHTSRSWLREDTGTAGSTGWGKLEEGISQNRVNWLLGRPRWIERTLAFEFWMYEVKTPLGSGVVTFENGVVYSWRLPAGAASAERR